MNQRKDDYMRGYGEGFREARAMLHGLRHVVEYRIAGTGPWAPMAAFDSEGAAQHYAKECSSNTAFEYHVVSHCA